MLCMRRNEASLPLNIHPAMCVLMVVCIPDHDSTRDTSRNASDFFASWHTGGPSNTCSSVVSSKGSEGFPMDKCDACKDVRNIKAASNT
jgi:hypothetical protein